MPRSTYLTVKELAEKAGQNEPLYITEHNVPPDFDFPNAFRVDTLPGLLFCQLIVKNASERRVIAWWKSRETFAQAWKEQFAELLGVHSVLCFEGFQLAHRVRSDRVGWLRPTAIVAAVGAFVALITGLSTIQDWSYSLLAIPDCTLWTDPVVAAKPIAVGEPFGIQIQVKNRHLRASSTATVKPVITGDGLKPAGDREPYSFRIEPGKVEVEEFRFVALHAGHHTIRFEGKQEGGSIYPPRDTPSLTITIDVWDSIDQTPRVSLVKASDRSASVSVELRNAKPTPYGTAFEATLTNPADIDIRPDKLTIRDAEDPLRNADFAQLRWRIPPSTETLKIQRFRLVLQEAGAKTRNADEWNELLKHLTVHADEPDELSISGQTK
jgi:hypothetical protein